MSTLTVQASLTLVFTHTKTGLPKEVCHIIEERIKAIDSKYVVETFSTKHFSKTTINPHTICLFVAESNNMAEMQKVLHTIEKNSLALGHTRFSTIVIGDQEGRVQESELQEFSLFRSKLIECGSIDILGNRIEVFPSIPNAIQSYIPFFLEEMRKKPGQVDAKRPSFFAPVTWALMDLSSKEFKSFVEKFRRHVPISSQIWLGQMVDCFSGTDAVDWICQYAEPGFIITREQAVGIGQKMLQAGVFAHITNELAFKDKPIVYKILSGDNGKKIWKAPAEWT